MSKQQTAIRSQISDVDRQLSVIFIMDSEQYFVPEMDYELKIRLAAKYCLILHNEHKISRLFLRSVIY